MEELESKAGNGETDLLRFGRRLDTFMHSSLLERSKETKAQVGQINSIFEKVSLKIKNIGESICAELQKLTDKWDSEETSTESELQRGRSRAFLTQIEIEQLTINQNVEFTRTKEQNRLEDTLDQKSLLQLVNLIGCVDRNTFGSDSLNPKWPVFSRADAEAVSMRRNQLAGSRTLLSNVRKSPLHSFCDQRTVAKHAPIRNRNSVPLSTRFSQTERDILKILNQRDFSKTFEPFSIAEMRGSAKENWVIGQNMGKRSNYKERKTHKEEELGETIDLKWE